MAEKRYRKFASEALTTCAVTADGASLVLGFKDSKGRETSLQLPVDQAGSLAMTLPALIEHALRKRYNDHSLRYVYPLQSWKVETSSDPRTGMITLRTSDGFSVCFSMPTAMQDDLSKALTAAPATTATALMN